MSSLSDLPGNPAYAGITPPSRVFVPAAPALAEAVRAAIPGSERVAQLFANGVAMPRFFRAEQNSGKPPLFLKLVDESAHAAIVEAESLISSLPEGDPAVRSCGQFPLVDGSGRILVAYPFVEGRFLSAPGSDMRALGRVIAILHRMLAGLPAAGRIQSRAEERAYTLDGVLARAQRHGPLLARAGIGALSGGLARAFRSSNAQPLHGDLNAGNILLEEGSGAIRIVDFEDVRHTHAPPLLDLALPVERFCLVLGDRAKAASAAIELLGAYADESRVSPIIRRGDLANALGIVNQRAVALLLMRNEAGLDVPAGELRKFGDLLRMIDERIAVIETVEKVLIS